jgi:hypothetical protein
MAQPFDHPSATLTLLLEPVGRCLTPDVAQELVNLRADPVVQKRIEELADKNTEGELSPEERDEYETYVRANEIIAILQAKARANETLWPRMVKCCHHMSWCEKRPSPQNLYKSEGRGSKREPGIGLPYCTAFCNSATRSLCSQGNSGRPKWP